MDEPLKIVNSWGKLKYVVLDFDQEADTIELQDPHTEETFIIHKAKLTLKTLGYKVAKNG